MATQWDFTPIHADLAQLNTNTIIQNPERLGKTLQSFVGLGSQLHLLHVGSLRVYANAAGDHPGKEVDKVHKIGDLSVAQTVQGLLAMGTKFFDAIIYLSIPVAKRPAPFTHDDPQKAGDDLKIPLYNDADKIIKFLFAAWFYVMIRAHPPSRSTAYKDQPTPRFISAVLGIKENESTIANYIASFPLENLDPSWVKHVSLRNISVEAMNRLGLGVAGYRICSVFNTVNPDADAIQKSKLSQAQLEASLYVAKSFKLAGACWDFHPSTRSPNLLSKYGNINKNMQNLMLEVYNEATLKRLKQLKKIYDIPTFDEGHTEYQVWTKELEYFTTTPIFTK